MIGIAISLYPQHAEYHDLKRAAVEAEALGIDVLYTWDHFFPLFAIPTASTLSAGRFSRRWPKSQKKFRSDLWSRAALTATQSFWPIWQEPSITLQGAA